MANGLFGTGIGEGRIRQTALQPAGIPGSTYVRPEQREAGRNLTALAQALGGLNNSLAGFAARQEQKQNDPDSDLNREWIARRQQMSLEQLREEARMGTPDGIRARQDALDALLGERANAEFRDRWLTFYNTEFDRTTGDMGAEYERMRQEHAAALPSEISRGNFYRLTGPHFEQWQNEDTRTKVGFVREQIATTVVQSFRTANEDMVAAGRTPEERASAIFQMSASNRTFLEMTGQEQNDTLFTLATEYALQGDEDMTRAILLGTRTGADGGALPSLASIPRYSTDAIRLMEQAGDIRDQQARDTGFETYSTVSTLVREGKFTDAVAEEYRGGPLFTDHRLSQLVEQSTEIRLTAETKFLNEQAQRQARLASQQAEQEVYAQAFSEMTRMNGTRRIRDVEVVNEAGTGTRTVSREQIIENVTDMFEQEMTQREQAMIEQGATPAQAAATVRQQRLMWYSQNNIQNQEWTDILNGMAPRATVEVLLERGEVSAQILEHAELYRELLAANPAYLSTMLTDAQSRAFLETYNNAVTTRRMPKEAALHHAATRITMPDSVRVQSMLPPDRTERMTNDALRDLGFDVDRSSNYFDVQQRITEMSLNGMTEHEIRTAIRSELENTTVEINGMLVRDHRDLPRDFPDLVQAELEEAFEVFGRQHGLPDVSDLYIIPVQDQSKWQIVSKYLGGSPIGTAYITPRSLDQRREQRQREHDALVLQSIQAQDAERAAYQARYEREIADMEALIDKYRHGPLSGGIADYLQGVLDDRLARDELLRNMTPESIREELDRIREQQQAGPTVGLGGFDMTSYGGFDDAGDDDLDN